MTFTTPAAGSKANTTLLESMVGVWQAYTVAWTSGGTAPVIDNGTLVGRYVIIGDTCHFTIKLTGGSGTTWGTGNYNFSLPVAAAATADHVGALFVGDSSVGGAGYSTGIAFIGSGGTTVGGYVGAKNAASSISNTNPQTFASGDRIWLTGTYEVA